MFEPEDILDALARGEMQSFCEGESWVVSEIQLFPRKRVLNIVAMVGRLEDLDRLYPRVVQFAQDVAADFIRVVGRPGWESIEPSRWGFHPILSVWLKEIE